MSTWAYCYECDEPLGIPTLGQRIVNHVKCPKCDYANDAMCDSDERVQLLDDINERLEALEDKHV